MALSRSVTFYFLMVLVSAISLLMLAEAMVRIIVSDETFLPISNIYQPVDFEGGSSYRYKPNYRGVAFGVELVTNNLGFRGPDWKQTKSYDTYRIALIGDSVAFGFGVPFDNTVGQELRKILDDRHERGHEVLNFGVNGYNSHQQKAVLEHIVPRFYPDLVILIPTNNDHQPALVADKEGWLHSDGNSENTRSRITSGPIKILELFNIPWWMEKSRLFLYLKLVYKTYLLADGSPTHRETEFGEGRVDWMREIPPAPVSARLIDTVYKPLKEMLAITSSRGYPTIVASFCGSLDYRQMLHKLSRETGAPLLELLSLFPEARNWKEFVAQFSLGWDSHPNGVAHRRWAVALADLIERKVYHAARSNSD